MIENKHTQHDLVQMQSLPLKAKIAMTKERIKQWYEHWDGNVYISFSGGKDSTVLKHIIDSMYDDVPAVFVDTGLEYPEIKKFVKDVSDGKYTCFNSDVVILRPEMRFDDVIKEKGYPFPSKEVSRKIDAYRKGEKWAKQYVERTATIGDGKFSNFCVPLKWVSLTNAPFKVSSGCCEIMKKKPFYKYKKETKRVPFVATMAYESKKRYTSWLNNGCNMYDSNYPQSKPLSFWKENDVLQYIKENNVPYATIYGDIVETGNKIENIVGYVPELKTTLADRTGCMFCMFGCQLEKESRFVRMKKSHPKQYEYCMKPIEEGGLGLKFVIDWVNENCGTHIEYDDKQLELNEGEKL